MTSAFPRLEYNLVTGEWNDSPKGDYCWCSVTDVGASLSHAAIVVREMGIPAVVGCGNATMLLETGDRVRVDCGRGIAEILSR